MPTVIKIKTLTGAIMAKYKKCPRCDINYITEEKEYCDICLAEMRGQVVFEDPEEEEEESELCPKCRINYLNEGEKLCESCAAEMEKRKGPIEKEFEWEPDAEEEEIEVDEDDIIIPDEVSLESLAEEESWTADDAEDISLDDEDLDEDFDEELLDIDIDEEEEEESEDEEEDEDY